MSAQRRIIADPMEVVRRSPQLIVGLQPGPAALTDGLGQLHRLIAGCFHLRAA